MSGQRMMISAGLLLSALGFGGYRKNLFTLASLSDRIPQDSWCFSTSDPLAHHRPCSRSSPDSAWVCSFMHHTKYSQEHCNPRNSHPERAHSSWCASPAPRLVWYAGSLPFIVCDDVVTLVLQSVAGAILQSRMYHTLPDGVDISLDLEHLSLVEPAYVRAQVVHSVSLSIQVRAWHPKLGGSQLIRRLSPPGV